jgi:hypothetical protein
MNSENLSADIVRVSHISGRGWKDFICREFICREEKRKTACWGM